MTGQSIMKSSEMDADVKAASKRGAKILKTKSTKKETTTMKSSKKTIVFTVLLTLIITAAAVAQALYFYNLGADTQKAENNRIRVEVAKQVAELKPAAQ